MKIAVFGTGYVGLVTALGFAKLGNKVYGIDKDMGKIESLSKGRVPFYEPGLQEILKETRGKGLVEFHTNGAKAVEEAAVIFICVGTPALPDGRADLSQVEEVARFIAENIRDYKVIAEKSTVPVKTSYWIKRTVNLYKKESVEFDVVSNPEFLREGSAVQDFFHPERIVVGTETERARNLMRQLYKDFDVPLLFTDVGTAEIIKHASNSFLAMKISFINMLAELCEKVDADVDMVSKGMGLDSRIGERFLRAGIGFGGSCFPKDLKAFYRIAEAEGVEFPLLRETERVNDLRPAKFIYKMKRAMWNLRGKKIGVLGLSFKPNTDDIREAPSLKVINLLKSEGAKIVAYDPAACKNARAVLPELRCASSPYEAAQGANAISLITEWEEFKTIDWKRIRESMETPLVFDGRNALDGRKLASLGFEYYPVGKRPIGNFNG